MRTLNDGNFLLSPEASGRLAEALIHPDPDSLRMRDEYLDSLASIKITSKENYIEVDVPELDLDFLENYENEKMTVKSQINSGLKRSIYSHSLVKMKITMEKDGDIRPVYIKEAADRSYTPGRPTGDFIKCKKVNASVA
jgi:hypothetical protein